MIYHSLGVSAVAGGFPTEFCLYITINIIGSKGGTVPVFSRYVMPDLIRYPENDWVN